MSWPVLLQTSAEVDIDITYRDMESIRAGLGGQFIRRVREIIALIEQMPELFGLVWLDVRAARLKQFRHVVYYVVLSDRVEIIAVIHGARDSSVWQSRY
jgi:toxin ParE1/3/4